MKTLSRHTSLPSMLIWISGLFSAPAEVDRGELTALIRVYDHGRAMPAHRVVQGSKAWASFQCDRDPPGQHLPAEPVDDRNEVYEAARHGDVGDVHSPDLKLGLIHIGSCHACIRDDDWLAAARGTTTLTRSPFDKPTLLAGALPVRLCAPCCDESNPQQ
jgi:hypothetical protein